MNDPGNRGGDDVESPLHDIDAIPPEEQARELSAEAEDLHVDPDAPVPKAEGWHPKRPPNGAALLWEALDEYARRPSAVVDTVLVMNPLYLDEVRRMTAGMGIAPKVLAVSDRREP